jgi:Baseplate J-like protein
MTLPQPNLDDKTFTVLVEEATKLIPRQAPEWTDHNRHDPGITFIELFAWLAEMQQYYLDRIGDESYIKYLKLLGTRPRGARPARAEATFKGVAGDAVKGVAAGVVAAVPRGTKLSTADNLVFETTERLLVVPVKLEKVLSLSQAGLNDHTDANDIGGLSFPAFGEEAEAGSQLYLGLDALLPGGQLIALTFNLFEQYAVARGVHGDERADPLPSALVVWEYSGANGKWLPLEILADVSAALASVPEKLVEGEEGCFQSRDAVRKAIENRPTFWQLSAQAQTLVYSAIERARGRNCILRALMEPDFLRLKGDETLLLSQPGRLFFTAPADMQKREIPPIAGELYWLRAVVRQAGYELPPRIDTIALNTVPVIQFDSESETLAFNGTGKLGQMFVAESYLALKGVNLVQVRERDGRWKDWAQQPDLFASGPQSLDYTLERDEGAGRVMLGFGDGTHGKIPPEGEANIRLISCLPQFEPRRLLGRSKGLPAQSFSLGQTGIDPAGFLLQVEEEVAVEPENSETAEVACLLRMTRTFQTRVKSGEPFTVKVLIEAKQDLCEFVLTERVTGDVRFNEGDWWKATFMRGTVRAGQTAAFSYTATATEEGGQLFGDLSFHLARDCPPLTAQGPRSVVEVDRGAQERRWRDWMRVEDFDASGPDDPHYVLNASEGEIRFGDGINGQIPQVPTDEHRKNIRVISLRTGGGEKGNVVASAVDRFAQPEGIALGSLGRLEVSNRMRAEGGSDAESLEEAEARARLDLKVPYQAVTSGDYEQLALMTPGLRVARARAIPLFSPDLQNYPRQRAAASVTVVVVPYSLASKPVPSAGFLRTVCRHLDRHRLLTTRVYVVAPDYVRVSVQATVRLRPGFDSASVTLGIINALDNFLRPLPAEKDAKSEGWPFGRTVYKSEIYQVIEGVEGVDCAQKVALVAQGPGVARSPEGNILITPQSLVYPGEHQIETESPHTQCVVTNGRKRAYGTDTGKLDTGGKA